MQPAELRAQLAQFTGSSTFTRHALIPRMLMTEGVVYLAQAAASHWLTDAIGSYLLDKRAQQEPFQAWRLAVDTQSNRAALTMTDGNSSDPIIAQQIDYTDFPLDQINLWLVADGEHWVLMLPTEY
ncbi:MAG: DUF6876 family protein [Planctomycetota bacterium]